RTRPAGRRRPPSRPPRPPRAPSACAGGSRIRFRPPARAGAPRVSSGRGGPWRGGRARRKRGTRDRPRPRGSPAGGLPRAAVHPRRLVRPVEAVQHDAEAVQRLDVAGFELDGALVGDQGAAQVVHVVQGFAQIVPGDRAAGIGFRGAAQLRDGGTPQPTAGEHHAQGGQRFAVRRRRAQPPVVAALRGGVLPSPPPTADRASGPAPPPTSLASQARYGSSPRSTGSASSSGTSYGCYARTAAASASHLRASVLSNTTTSVSSVTFPAHR